LVILLLVLLVDMDSCVVEITLSVTAPDIAVKPHTGRTLNSVVLTSEI